MNHTMVRVKDAEKSLKFYQETMGMTLLREAGNAAAGFTLYFLGYPGKEAQAQSGKQADVEGLLELTWNHGTEKDEAFSYHNGNDQPQGFGHIGMSHLSCVSCFTNQGGIVLTESPSCYCRQPRCGV